MLRVETPEQYLAIKQFRELVPDLDPDEITDLVLLRYLRARETPDKAELSLRKTLKWREETKIASFLHWRPLYKIVEQQLPFKYQGRDKEYRPVYWIPVGRWTVRQLLHQGFRDEVHNYIFHLLEHVRADVQKLGQHQCVLIFGLERLPFSQVMHLESMQLMFSTFQILEQHYPETIKTMFILNAPRFFPHVVNFARPLLTPRTSAKLRIFNSDKRVWLAALRETMPEKTIPEEYRE